MADNPIVEHTFAEAEDFLAALRPSADLWKADPGAWVFRGHADSTWRLLPSQNRRASLERYFGPKYRGDGLYCNPDASDLGKLMVEFVYALDRAGHRVPGPDRFKMEEIAEKVAAGMPDGLTHELVALAQHNDLPTYLLDWTRHAATAAYFAASETANLRGELEGEIEVWGLKRDMIEGASAGQIDGHGVRLHVSTPPLRGNANLHAQGGLFTYSIHRPDRDAPAADDVVRAMASANVFPVPVMHRLRLPQKRAGGLLYLLSHDPVTGGSLFPGYGGVARDVRDRMRFPEPLRQRLLRLNARR
jgi:hypothetical protein